MMRRVSICVSLLTLISCAGTPRYGREGSFVPKDASATAARRTTNDFLRLGMILQKSLGRPYQGTSRYQTGLDCSNFTRQVFHDYNGQEIGRSVEDQYAKGREVPRTRLHFGDLVFFETERDRVSHVGVYVGYNEFIHVSSSQGVIISSLRESYWADRFVGARRLIE